MSPGPHSLNQNHRWWLSASAVVAGVAAFGALAWLLPGSPVTLWRADAALATHTPDQAVALYDDVAHSGWWTSLQATALRRSAAVLSTEMDQPAEARQRLQHLLAITTGAADRAQLRERLGLLLLAERDLSGAARSFVASVQADPRSERAGERLSLAARTASEAGDAELAAALWQQLADDYEPYRALAMLAQGRAALRAGDAQRAHARFSEAVAASRSPDLGAAARLGVATCLERLGNLDEAIAEIDLVDLPGEVRESRLDALRTRREVQER